MSPVTSVRTSSALTAALLSVVVGIGPRATGVPGNGGALHPQATSPACRVGILKVWNDLLGGGTPWHHDLFSVQPLVSGEGVTTAVGAARTIARTRGLVPACSVLTVSYTARSLALFTLFGGPSALAHLRAQWAAMSSAQRATFEGHLFFGEPSSAALSAGKITVLARRPGSEKIRVGINERVAGTTSTVTATVTVVRLARRWYVSSYSSLGMSIG